MRLFPPLLQIDENEGFNPAKDIFGRKKIADGLTHLVSQVEDPIVLAVDGQWGSGKTIFLKMWRGELQQLGFPVIYFDAFANDYFEDAFVPLAAEIIGLAQTKLKANASTFEDLKTKTTKVAKVVLRSALRIGVKAATLGAIDASDIEGTIADEVETAFDKHVGELITKQDAVKSDMIAFKEALENLPKLFGPAGQNEEQIKPIIIIIDELDRCRPSYALQLLERMKHFFSVSKVHFVLGANLSQLANSVVATYGAGINSELYLQKFIQLSIQLQDQFDHSGATTISKFLNHLVDQSNLAGDNRDFVLNCCNDIHVVAERNNLSLRTIEQVFGHVIRMVAITPKNMFKNSSLVAGLSILKVVSPNLFYEAKRGTIRYSQVANVFGLLDSAEKQIDASDSVYKKSVIEQRSLESWWRFVSDRNCPSKIMERLSGALNSFSSDQPVDLLIWCANNQMDKFRST